METPEAVNRLLHEIKKALPYWEKKLGVWGTMDTSSINLTVDGARDTEVEEALKNLIKAIQEETNE